mmetsp:Transcript_5933/g.7328  ORF Transcript_5933/g.7328 Transcript_5933/m.7328 type:complete len:242 (+) Transcript_5933:409-1134(+)
MKGAMILRSSKVSSYTTLTVADSTSFSLSVDDCFRLSSMPWMVTPSFTATALSSVRVSKKGFNLAHSAGGGPLIKPHRNSAFLLTETFWRMIVSPSNLSAGMTSGAVSDWSAVFNVMQILPKQPAILVLNCSNRSSSVFSVFRRLSVCPSPVVSRPLPPRIPTTISSAFPSRDRFSGRDRQVSAFLPVIDEGGVGCVVVSPVDDSLLASIPVCRETCTEGGGGCSGLGTGTTTTASSSERM